MSRCFSVRLVPLLLVGKGHLPAQLNRVTSGMSVDKRPWSLTLSYPSDPGIVMLCRLVITDVGYSDERDDSTSKAVAFGDSGFAVDGPEFLRTAYFRLLK